MIGFNLDINSAKKLFFDRQAVVDAIDAASHQVLSKFGLYVRREARKSIRNARPKKISELTPWERRRYRIAEEYGRRGGYRAMLPIKPSDPGKPHKARTGLIRDFILYSYEPSSRSVLIGPSRIATKVNAPEVLEWGGNNENGVRIDPRPTMQLAMAKKLPELAKLWKNSVR